MGFVAITAVVFDFDGLLMDTESTGFAAWQYEWRQHGLELDPAGFWADHGGDITELRRAALAAAVGPSFDAAASDARRQAYRAGLNRDLELRAGIDAWLAEGRAAGLRLAVATSSHTGWAEAFLAQVDRVERFDVFACGDEVARTKPAPDVYQLALRRLGVPACQAVAVEDSPHGVAAAQAAGMRCVGIPSPHVTPDRLAAADLVLGSAAEASLAEALAACQPAAG